jgi:predicted small lipoprotein YifL
VSTYSKEGEMKQTVRAMMLLWAIVALSGCESKNPAVPSADLDASFGMTEGAGKEVGTQDISLFGGRGYRVYLGCWSCPSSSSSSIFNKYGQYGSKYSDTSIFNKYGQYGGAYGTYSPCNKYSSTPPKLVDGAGKFYGYLTLNQSLINAITDRKIVDWLTVSVCGGR